MPLTNVFRTDGWVKTVQGYAVPGAQVWVCLQPANVASLPPSPLANIFSDVNGLVPITQPIITDGFGHYDFYALAGVYTLIISIGGVISQVYPDQSVGGASGTGTGGTALTLQVNGTPNVNQFLLNLAGANSVSVTDSGNGTVSITGAVFQTSGVPNTLQSVFNLKAGTNLSLSADALGGVTINATSQGTSLSTAGQGWMWSTGLGIGAMGPLSNTEQTYTGSANTVVAYQLVVPLTITVRSVTIHVSGTDPSGSINAGIYTINGNTKLLDVNIPATASGAINAAVTPTVIPAGVYWFAFSNTGQPNVSFGPQMLAGNASVSGLVLNKTQTRFGTAANATVAGVLPATLGSITNNFGQALPAFLLEV